ncbi:MAG: hypothetical protein WED07_03715 [Candidatus Freyarchaeum deiterrae]
MSVSYVNTGLYEPLIYLINSILLAACAVYLVRHYLEKRKILTWLFVLLFVWLASFFFVDFLVVTDVIQLDVIMLSLFAFLIATGIIATIGLVMLGFKSIYLLPTLIVLIIFFYNQTSVSNYNYLVNSIQLLSYLSTGNFLAEPWFIILKDVFPNFFVQRLLVTNLLNLLFDPIALIFPNSTVLILSIFEGALAVPTTILFYYLAWKNRSGRSLGFALGLTTYLILGVITIPPGIVIRGLSGVTLMFAAALFLALGILGVFDKLISKENSQKGKEKNNK